MERADQRLDRTGITKLPEGFYRLEAHVGVLLVAQCLDQPFQIMLGSQLLHIGRSKQRPVGLPSLSRIRG